MCFPPYGPLLVCLFINSPPPLGIIVKLSLLILITSYLLGFLLIIFYLPLYSQFISNAFYNDFVIHIASGS